MTDAMNEGYFLSFPPLTSLIITATLAAIALTIWAIRKSLSSSPDPALKEAGSGKDIEKNFSHGKSQRENPHAVILRQGMADIWLHCLDQPVSKRTLSLSFVWTTLYDVLHALLRKKVAFAQLEPEVCDFDSIIRWLSVEAKKAVDEQEMTWSYFSVESEEEFENILSSYHVLFKHFQENHPERPRYGRTEKGRESLLT